MALRKALVLGPGGKPQQLQAGDTLAGVGGGGTVTITEVAVDFGAGPKASTVFDISLAGATVGQNVLATPSQKPGPGLDEDELEVEPIFAAGRVVTSDFVRLLVGPQSPHGLLSGIRYINVILG